MGLRQDHLRIMFAAAMLPVFAVTLGLAAGTPVMHDSEAWGYDLLVHLGSRAAAHPAVVVVDLDDALIQRLQRFPVPRGVVATLLRKVAAAHPDLIGFDLLLSERRAPGEDRDLQDAIAAAGNVVVATQLGSADMPVSEPLAEYCVPDPDSPSNCRQGAALGLGFINLPVDDDGFVRRTFLLPPRGYPVLPFAVALASDHLRVPLSPCGPQTACLGALRIAMDGGPLRTALIGWPAAPPAVIPAGEVLDGHVPATAFAGKVVLIGQSSSAGNDLHLTPQFRFRDGEGRRRLMPGTLAHAAALQTLLQGAAVRPLGFTAGLAAACAYAMAALLLMLLAPPRWSLPGVLLLGAAAFLVALAAFAAAQLWQPFLLSGLGLALSVPLAFGYRFVEERWLKGRAEQERGELMGMFSRYVSPEVAEQIWARRGEITLAGEEREATIMFTDIRNFTAITAGKPPGEVLLWLNDYLTEMAQVIEAERGLLNKFIGDGIMVLFGVPLSAGPAEDAAHALNTALRMLERVEHWNARHRGDARFPEIKIGIGIHSGQVTAGNVGSRTRLEYSVIGAAVNLASRLESLTKELHAPIVVTAETEALVRGRFQTRDLGETAVRGFAGKIRVYTVLGKQAHG